MPQYKLMLGMLACLLVGGISFWRSRKRPLGVVPFIAPHYIQLTALIIFLALAANLFALVTGIEWQPPFRR